MHWKLYDFVQILFHATHLVHDVNSSKHVANRHTVRVKWPTIRQMFHATDRNIPTKLGTRDWGDRMKCPRKPS